MTAYCLAPVGFGSLCADYQVSAIMSGMLRKLNQRWNNGTDRDIEQIANVLRYALAYDPNKDHCKQLTWDMHLIAHKDDKNPHKRCWNRFACHPATSGIVKRRVGEALAFYEYLESTSRK